MSNITVTLMNCQKEGFHKHIRPFNIMAGKYCNLQITVKNIQLVKSVEAGIYLTWNVQVKQISIETPKTCYLL